MADTIVPSRQVQANSTPLYPGNQCWLYQTPLYLYPGAEYTLNITVEQDPVKWYSMEALFTEDMWLWWASGLSDLGLTNLAREDTIPWLVQGRGVWKLVPASTYGVTRSQYLNYFYAGQPQSPDAPIRASYNDARDLWYATRAFQPAIDIYTSTSAGAWQYVDTIEPSATDHVVVCHHGGHTVQPYPHIGKPAQTTHACGVSSYDPAYNLYATYGTPGSIAAWKAARDGSRLSWSGSHEGVAWTATVDEYNRLQANVTSTSKPVRCVVRWHQEHVPLPGGWGINGAMEYSYYDSTYGLLWSGRNEYGTPVDGYVANESELPSVGEGTGVDYAQPLKHSGAQRHSAWLDGSSYSVDSDHYDYTDMGDPNTRGQLKLLTSGARKTEFTGPPVTYSAHASLTSPLLIGYARPADHLAGAALHKTPGSSFLTLSVSASTEAAADEVMASYAAIYKELEDRARDHDAPHQLPRAKVSITSSIISTEGDPHNVSKVYYVDMPYTYQSRFADVGWLTGVQPTADVSVGGATSVVDREVNDWLSQGEIGTDGDQLEVMLNDSGTHISSTSGRWYEGADGYIYYETDKQTYKEWRDA